MFANISALIWENYSDINWAGFYFIRDGRLLLGPFQGKTACISIDIGKGVCGTAALTDAVQRVDDVHSFKGHIACDSASNSEIVLPIHCEGKVCAVLDMDSPVFSRFTEEDEDTLKKAVEIMEKYIEF